MSKLAVANIIFETTESNRIEYTGNNVVRVRANGGLQIPFGTTAQRVPPEYGIIRYNTDLQTVEMYDAGGWYNMPTGGYVNNIYTVANSAYAAANNVGPQIAPTFNTANAAYNQANLAYTSSNVVYAAVNSAFATINADYAFTNSSYASINSNWTVTNTVYGVANAAYGAANNVGPQIAPAYNTANAAFAAANTKFSSSGGTISGAVEITADLTVHGNTTFVDQTTLSVGDPLIYLAANNYTGDVVDIGFVANYVNATSSNVHTGLFRSSGTKEYYLFQGYDKEPINNYIDPTGNNITMAVLNSTVRTSNLILGGANAINWITSGYGVANAAFGKANTALQNTSGTFAGSLTVTGSLVAGGQLRSTSQGGNFIYPADSGYEWWTGAWNDYVSYQITRRNTSSGVGYPYFTIDTTGRIGVGTYSPSANVEIYGRYPKLWISETSATDTVELFLKQAGNMDEGFKLTYDSATGHSYLNSVYFGGSMYFQTANSTKMIIDSTGRLGIGTTSPTEKLHIYDASADPYLLVDGSGGNRDCGVKIKAGSTTVIALRSDYTGAMFLNAGGSTALNLNSAGTGNIVIGGGGGVTNILQSARSPIFYDYDNTSYYTDPASTSVVNTMQATTYVVTGGSYITAKDGGSANLNSLYVFGAYRVNGANPQTPVTKDNNAMAWGQLLSVYGGSDTVTQIYGDYDSGTLYTRSGNGAPVGGGYWRAWRPVLDALNFNNILGSINYPASSGFQLFCHNPNLPAGLYWFKNSSGTVQQLYCDVPAGGWVLVGSNNANDGTIPGGASKNSTSYYLNRNGGATLGTASPNSDYLIGSFLDNFTFTEARCFAFGRGSTNGTYSYSSPGTYIEAIMRMTGVSGAARYYTAFYRDSVQLSGNSTVSGQASWFVLDGIYADNINGGFGANSNQSTIGLAGVYGSSGDPGTGCYLGHGSTEGNYEGWYDSGNSSADCQGYTTWVR